MQGRWRRGRGAREGGVLGFQEADALSVVVEAPVEVEDVLLELAQAMLELGVGVLQLGEKGSMVYRGRRSRDRMGGRLG